MIIINFNIVAIFIIILWLVGIVLLYLSKPTAVKSFLSITLIICGVFVISLYLAYLWLILGHAPLRNLGYTRLWYSLFLSGVGLLIFYKLKIKWILLFNILMSIMFLLINVKNPESIDKTLIPALQSIWFIPHVIVYIFAYSILASSSIIAFRGLFLIRQNKFEPNIIYLADNTVITGFAFLTLGLLFGALWAKEAWGQFWTWDPKEIWALLTWLLYLFYIHFRFYFKNSVEFPLWILLISFLILLICWFGINYLPAAQTSLHSYRIK